MKRAIFVSIGLVLLAGCGGKRGTGGSVTGTVTYNGNAVNRATLFFHPTSGGDAKDVDVMTSQDGTFTATDIPPGEYKIYIQPQRLPPGATKGPQIPKGMDEGKAAEMKKKFEQMRGQVAGTIAFPKKYHQAESSDLKCTISQGKKENLDLKLSD